MSEQEIQVLPMTIGEYVLITMRLKFKKKLIYFLIAYFILFNIYVAIIGFYIYLLCLDILVIFLFFLSILFNYKKYAKSSNNEAPSFISITQERFKIRSSAGNVEASWNLIKDVKNETNFLAIYTGTNKKAIIIPKRSFQSELEAEHFVRTIEQYWKKDNAS